MITDAQLVWIGLMAVAVCLVVIIAMLNRDFAAHRGDMDHIRVINAVDRRTLDATQLHLVTINEQLRLMAQRIDSLEDTVMTLADILDEVFDPNNTLGIARG